MSARKTQEDYERLARSKGVIFVGPLPSGVREYTKWRCKQGHVFSNAYFNLAKLQGTPCDVCSRKSRRKSERDYRELAKRKGNEWIGKHLPRSSTDLTKWRCVKGHTFSASFNQLSRADCTGNGCKYCSGKAQKTAEDYRNLARDKGLKWLGPHPGSVHGLTNWECSEGHVIQTSFHVLKKAPNNGCEICSGMAKKRQADYKALAKDRGMRWIGPRLPKDTKTPTNWECLLCGHQWMATFGNICHQRSSCPKCVDMEAGKRVSRPQRQLAVMLNGKLNQERCGYTVDVVLAMKGHTVCVEYDSWRFHGDRQDNDRLRDESLIQSGAKLLVIKSNGQLPTRSRLAAAVKTLLGGCDRVEIGLPDWGVGDTVGRRKGKRREVVLRTSTLPKKCVGIRARASDCIAELDGHWLHIRRGSADLHRVQISPAQVTIIEYALLRGRARPRILTFTCDSIHHALGRLTRSDRASCALVARLRNCIRFLEGEYVGLVHGMSKRRWQTSVRVQRRPQSRLSAVIQTPYGAWRSFKEARAFVHRLNIRSQIEWRRWSKTPSRPDDIPSNPQRTYRAYGWKDWADWLGTRSDKLKEGRKLKECGPAILDRAPESIRGKSGTCFRC